MTENPDPTYLSLDDIIRLNKVKCKGPGSVRSHHSNRSNRSNYSNRSHGGMSNKSYGGMSNRSHRSNYSNRSNGNREVLGYNYGNRRRNSTELSNERGAVRRRLGNRNNDRRRYQPYVRRTVANNPDPDSKSLIIRIPNGQASRRGLIDRPRLQRSVLTADRLAQFEQSNVSPLIRMPSLSSRSRAMSSTRKRWGPKLNKKTQKRISDFMAASTWRFPVYTAEELNNCEIKVDSTKKRMNDRFFSYLLE